MNIRTVGIGVLCVLLILSGLVVPVSANAQTQNEDSSDYTKYHLIHNVETGETTVQLAVKISDTQDYSDWTLTWSIPKSAEITEVKTATSTSVTRERDGERVTFKEEDGSARSSETFYVNYTLSQSSDTVSATQQFNITQHTFRLSALSDASSSARIEFTNTTDELANIVRYSNHSVRVENQTALVNGTGPTTVVTNLKNDAGAVQTDDYVVYNKNISTQTLNNSYAISTIGTGVIPQYHQVPVIVINSDEYDKSFESGTAGRYQRGVIYLSEDATGEDELLPLLTHEYTHSIIGRISYHSTPRWFNEGSSQYTESIARDKVGRSQTNIDEGDFWDYHSENKSWVVTNWDSLNGSVSHFAYAYSELLFKQYARTTSPENVQQLYKDITYRNVTVTENTTPRILYGDAWSGRLCEAPSKSHTMQCLDDTVEYVPNSTPPDRYATPFGETVESPEITFEPRETPTPTPTSNETPTESDEENTSTETNTKNSTSTPTESSENTSDESLIDKIFSAFFDFIRWLIDLLLSLF